MTTDIVGLQWRASGVALATDQKFANKNILQISQTQIA